AAGLQREVVERVPYRLRQPRAGIKKHAHAAEKLVAQRRLALQITGQFLVAARHIEIDGGGNLAQVGRGFFELNWQWPAIVDIERAAVVEHESDVVIASKRVIPR